MNKLPHVAFALAAGFLVGTATQAQAEPITFQICDGKALYFKQPKGTDRLEVRCSVSGPTVFTIQGCVGPRVKRLGEEYTVTCDRFVAYTQGVPVK